VTETLATAETFAPQSPDAPWTDQLSEPLVCTRVVDVTHDVRSFELRPLRPRPLAFRPGQYLTITASVAGVEYERCYTISSPPTRSESLEITVKRTPGGPVSTWLHDHLRVGDTLRASGPLGLFSMDNHPANKYLFLSAGSGITPLMSMARTLCDRSVQTDVVLVHNARTPDDIVFRHELESTVARHGITTAIICEDDSPSERWAGPRGRLTVPMLLSIAPDLLDREVFTCGPPAYMAAVREMLELLGADPTRCHEESFTIDSGPPTTLEPDAGVEQHTVEFRRSGRVVTCGSDTSILDAAQNAGLTLPSSCGEGVCGTCKSTLLDGTVDMRHAGGIRPREIADNKILLCSSRPCGDLVIDA
jgi:glycine betaine catabolism B